MKTAFFSICFFMLGLNIAFGAYPITGTSQDAYCVVPPYLTQNVKPNINLVLDFSGSMQFPAYLDCSGSLFTGYNINKAANCGTNNTPSSSYLYSTAKEYYGNFKDALYYKYNAGGYFEENLTCTNTDKKGTIGSNCLSGNLLNWITTTRMDVLRRILTGGRIKSATTDVLESEGASYVVTDTALHCKFTVTANTSLTRLLTSANQTGYTCAIGTFSNYNMDTKISDPTTYITGIVQSMYPGLVDLELSTYNSDAVTYDVGKNKTLSSYVDAINSKFAYNGTPTGEALRESKYYFQQSSSMTATNESNVIGITDYTKDPYYEGANLPAPCRKSFALLISDGQWNGSVDPASISYSMRTTDQRTESEMSPDKQTVATYAVYAFGDGVQGRQAMITTALFGGFDDNDLNTWPYGFTSVPSSLTTTYPRSVCNPAGTWNAGCSEWDKDKSGLPYNFFEGSDGSELKTAITKAVNDILGRTASGTAASVMGNNDSSGAILLQALYFPAKQFESGTQATWLGEVQSLWYYVSPQLTNINIREDTEIDKKLRLTTDRIASFDFNGTQTTVNLYTDANGDGAADTPTTAVANVSVDEVQALWRAGLNLWSRAASDRSVYVNNPSISTYQGGKIAFSSANASILAPYLDVASSVPDSTNVINYTLGSDVAGYRGRAVTIGGVNNVWKLGDIINSSPRMLTQLGLNTYNLSQGGYKDTSYNSFVKSNTYLQRNVTFVGGNDGMLHAFSLGRNFTGSAGFVSELKNGDGTTPVTNLGKELWGFVPKNSLPYLKHLGNPSYRHLYYVNSTPLILDAAIGQTKLCPAGTTCTVQTCSTDLSGTTPYYACPKVTTTDTNNFVSYDVSSDPIPSVSKITTKGTSWRTILIGSMGYGGASRDQAATCTDCVKTPVSGIGFSSYFALDITDPSNPQLLWEFSHPRLGFSSVGPAVMRIKDTTDTTTNSSKNGHWFAVLASGPTGPIDSGTNQMKALSDQSLSIFVLDLKTGTPLRTFSPDATALISGVGHTQVTTMPSLAYGGTFSDSTIDTDQWNISRAGAYSDDALYLGYVRKDTTTGSVSINKFAKGGVLRLLTNDDPDPANWKVSTVIDGVGPVSSSIVKLQDTYARKLWLFFGTGRYTYKSGATIDEDYTGQQEAIYGIKDPCYVTADNDLSNIACTSSVDPAALTNQSTTISSTISTGGWKINLAAATSNTHAQRVITNPVSSSLGLLFFTAMKPSASVCSYGGTSSLWAINYSNGGAPPSALRGSALMQQSTGASQQITLTGAFVNSLNRESVSIAGVPPSGTGSEPPITSNADHTPSRKILHIQER